jgi:hypothetical protein
MEAYREPEPESNAESFLWGTLTFAYIGSLCSGSMCFG